MINIGIIEDDKNTLEAFKLYFQKNDRIGQVFFEYNTADFIKNNSKISQTLNIIFLDIDLNGESGIDAIIPIKNKFPSAEIVMFTASEDTDSIVRAMTNGASSYITKTTYLKEVEDQLDIILDGGAIISPMMAKKLIHYFIPKQQELAAHPREILKPIEIQVLNLLRIGMSYEAAAQKLNMKIDTLRYYIKMIYKKLDASNKVEAINKVFPKM
jgi:DNA-binding NarL/FixJ family response regulator